MPKPRILYPTHFFGLVHCELSYKQIQPKKSKNRFKRSGLLPQRGNVVPRATNASRPAAAGRMGETASAWEQLRSTTAATAF